MTKIKSISDLSSLYESIYNQEIVEEKKSGTKFPKGTFQKAGEEAKEPKTMKDSGPEAAKGFKKVKKSKKKGGKLHKENINSFMKSKFDKLFENVMDDEMDTNMDLGPSAGPEDAGADEMDLDTELDTDTDLGGEGEEVTLTLDREVAQKLYDMLGDILGGAGEGLGGEEESDLEDLEIEDEGESEGEDEFGSEESEDEDCEEWENEEGEMREGIESEKLSDERGKGLTKGMEAAGNVKARTGKASSDVTDEVSSKNLGDKWAFLTKPGNNKVGNIRQGQDLFKK